PFSGRSDLEEVERVRTTLAEEPDRRALVACTKSLAGVFNEDEVVFTTQRHNLIHTRHAATHVNKQYSLGAGCDGRPNALGTQTKGFVDLCKYRQGATEQHGFDCRDVRKRRYDDFVTCANAGCRQCARHRCGAARDRMGVFGPRDFSYFRLEFACFPDVLALGLMVIPEENSGL